MNNAGWVSVSSKLETSNSVSLVVNWTFVTRAFKEWQSSPFFLLFSLSLGRRFQSVIKSLPSCSITGLANLKFFALKQIQKLICFTESPFKVMKFLSRVNISLMGSNLVKDSNNKIFTPCPTLEILLSTTKSL